MYVTIANVVLLILCVLFLGFNYMCYMSWNNKPFPFNKKRVGMHLSTKNWYIGFSCAVTIVLMMYVSMSLHG